MPRFLEYIYIILSNYYRNTTEKNGKISPSICCHFIVKKEYFPAWQESIAIFQHVKAIQEPDLSA
jgi:hypothetical protein